MIVYDDDKILPIWILVLQLALLGKDDNSLYKDHNYE